MPTEIEVIFTEFSSELDALTEMTAPAHTGDEMVLTARARVAAGNGATLLLAAIFEEFVRQIVKVAFREKAKGPDGLGAFPDKLTSVVWRRSLERLARTSFDDIKADGIGTDARVSAILSFCLRGDTTANVGDTLAHNDRNMRPEEFNRLFKQIGYQGMIGTVCENNELIQYLAAEGPVNARLLVESRLKDFFRRRNEIAHAIKLGSSSGPSQLVQDVELFRAFGHALTLTLRESLYQIA